MRAYTALVLLLLSVVGLVAGCTPRVIVRRSPPPGDKGIRYYRPKPYLLLTPYDGPIDVNAVVHRETAAKIELKWLPDFTEEYSVHVRPGIGSADVQMTLTDGWNLTTINQKLDTQLDEVINAVANLLKSAAPTGIPAAVKGADAQAKAVVNVTNVPFGFYEAVIGTSAAGEKRLYGWRYVGFVPFAYCPLDTGGIEGACCDTLDLYGLVFENGVMTFRRLCEIEADGQIGNQIVKPRAAPASEAEEVPPATNVEPVHAG